MQTNRVANAYALADAMRAILDQYAHEYAPMLETYTTDDDGDGFVPPASCRACWQVTRETEAWNDETGTSTLCDDCGVDL